MHYFAYRLAGYRGGRCREEGAYLMGVGTSVFLIAVGAILAWAVDAHVAGVDLDVVGVILMVVGAIGLLFSLVHAESWRWPR